MNAPSTIHPSQLSSSGDSSIGGILLASGKITPENAERVLRMQKELGIRFGEAAQRLGLITEADIQQVLARQFDYPYLQAGEHKYSEKLLAAYQPFSPQVEQLRAARSQLMLRWMARGRKALAVVAVGADDGSDLLAANLAVVFSQLGERTLLVDANLRQPSLHGVFGLPAGPGLSDVLAGRAAPTVASRIDGLLSLSVLTAGTLPPNPLELLSRPQFAQLNQELEAAYDVVLYHAAPFTLGSDALAVGARAGGVLLVARSNQTLLADAGLVTDELKQAGAEVVGAVMVDF
ncbi:chain length determinant protein tyrosine kinase EpsG [Oxalobacteraceae bacterium A2-2]